MFKMAKECHQNFNLLCTMILIIHHFFLVKSGSPLMCFHLKGTFYYAKDYQHVKNEVFYVSKSVKKNLNRVMQGVTHEGF